MNHMNPKPFVFVLMPFHSEFDDIYQLGIKPACAEAGAYCERVDEQIFTENILVRVYNQIIKADIVVAEMTGRNPNVFYETGYAHALNKRAILLTQTVDDIPFDLKHYPHVVYGSKIAFLKSELEKRIRWCIDNPTQSTNANVGIEEEKKPPTFDLTGIWDCDDRAAYYIRQLGNRIFWVGERSPQNPKFCNVAYGTVFPSEVRVQFADVPKGINREWGTLVLQITDNGTRMTAIRKTGNFGGSMWVRIPR